MQNCRIKPNISLWHITSVTSLQSRNSVYIHVLRSMSVDHERIFSYECWLCLLQTSTASSICHYNHDILEISVYSADLKLAV